MISWIKNIIKPTLEEQLFTLEYKNKILIADIQKGRKIFTDNERVIEFCNLLIDRLINTYKHKGNLTYFEMVVLDKALTDGVYSMSFLLLSQLNKEENINSISTQLKSKGFHLIDTVGYINIKRILPYTQLIHEHIYIKRIYT